MAPLTLYFSYAHEDEALRQQLEMHLVLLRREGLISDWHDRKVLPGEMKEEEIDKHLHRASIILVLLSPNLLASEHYEKETQCALERHGRGETYIVPIILRPCDWQHTPLKHFQCFPHDGKPLTQWSDQDEAFETMTQGLRDYIEKQKSLALPLTPSDRRSREKLLSRVRNIWINGVLNPSLHGTTRIDLCLQDRPDVLINPLLLQIQELHQSPEALPAGTTIVQMYDRGDGELLILGKPGAGKTTLLLELTRTLLERAEHVERLRIPVVFNLSSWAKKQQSLSVWLADELVTKYQMPSKVVQRFIEEDRILPLLDGLDEVAKKVRASCVQQINDYCQWRLEIRGSCPIVICCRSEEYDALTAHVSLQNAVSIFPLTNTQIDAYLEQAGEQMKVLKQALKKDARLRELARQPLMLNIFVQAYQGAKSGEVPEGKTPKEIRHTIFARYVERMLKEHREELKLWKPEQVIHWLAFLAKQMQQHDQTVFSLENLEPDWLVGKWKTLYHWSIGPTIGLITGLAEGLADGPLMGLGYGLVCMQIIIQTDLDFASVLPGGRYWGGLLSGRTPLSPNEGTWRNGALGLAITLIGGLVLIPLYILISMRLAGRVFGLVGTVVFLPLLTLDPFARHFFLRLLLRWRGDLPWRLVPFLDETAKRLLLRKVGGSYIFIHRQLLDYFAELERK